MTLLQIVKDVWNVAIDSQTTRKRFASMGGIPHFEGSLAT